MSRRTRLLIQLQKNQGSIYEDLHINKEQLKITKSELEIAKARNVELEALLQDKSDAKTPKEKSEAAADIKAYAEKHGLDADTLEEFASVVLAKVPKQDTTVLLSPEEKQELPTLRDKDKRAAEDADILKNGPGVKSQLQIHDDAELQKVMAGKHGPTG